MIRNRKDGSEYAIPNIVDKWERNGGSELKHYKSDQLLGIVSACAAMLKTMRMAELDLTFDFNAERMDFLARMAEFKLTAELALDVLDERLGTERVKLEDVERLGRLAEAARNGKYVPPAVRSEWMVKSQVRELDDAGLNETLETINVLIGEMQIVLANLDGQCAADNMADYRYTIRAAKREFNSAQHLVEEERARRRRLLTKPHPADLFPHDWANDHKVRISMLSDELIAEKHREFLAKEEAVNAQIENAPEWWTKDVFSCAAGVLETIRKNALYCEQEAFKREDVSDATRRRSADNADGEVLLGKDMMSRVVSGEFGPVIVPITNQELFFRALMHGRVELQPETSIVFGADVTSYRVTILPEAVPATTPNSVQPEGAAK